MHKFTFRKPNIIGLSALIILLAASVAACSGGSSNSGETENTITIKGNFSGGNHASLFNRFFAWIFPTAQALNPNDISKVIVFQRDGGYTVSAVSNSSFSIAAQKGSPAGLIFAGANNNYLGYLTLSNGIDSIPLTKVADGVTSIDLQTISSNGIVASPIYNPIGTELPLSTAEQSAIAQCNGMFASIVKNPDIDGNGTIDLLEGKFYLPWITYGIYGGNFGGAYTPTINSTVNIESYNISIGSQNTTTDAGGATVTGPMGSGITNMQCYETSNYYQVHYSLYPDISTRSPSIPSAGQYRFTLKNGKVLTFSVPDQSLASTRTVVAVPTITLNNNGTINKINWVYKIPNDSSSTLTPTAIMDTLMIQIDNAFHTRLYDSPWLASTTDEHLLTNQNISWSNVNNIYMTYNDVYGNHYVVNFIK